eukprot:gene13490-9651_t
MSTPSPSPMSNNGKMPRCLIEKEFERKRAYDIMRRMDSEQHSLTICEWGARGFASIAGMAMTTQNAESLADFLDDGGCEALVQIMNKYAEMSVVVAAYGCLTASILAWSLRELKEFLGEIGAGEIIVFATTMHIGDPLVSEFGTRAIGLLAKQNISNSYRLAQAGACDALAQAGNFGFNLRHDRAVDVAANVCLAFSELAEAVNATRLMECGASALVVELTKYHHKSDDFARAAMRAICALASLNAQHREELGRCDAHGIELLRKTQFSPRASYKARENIVTLLDLLATEMAQAAEANGDTSAAQQHSGATAAATPGANPYHYQAHHNGQAGHVHPARHMVQFLHGSSSDNNNGDLVSIIHGSEMKGDTVPLKVEVREVIEYSSFVPFAAGRRSPSPEQDDAATTTTTAEDEDTHSSTATHKTTSPMANSIFTQNNRTKAHNAVVEL